MRIGPFALYARVADLSNGRREGGLENLGGQDSIRYARHTVPTPGAGRLPRWGRSSASEFRLLPELIRDF